MIRSREWIKTRVSVRADEFNVRADSVGGATALEDPIKTIEDELNQAAVEVIRNAREDFLFPILESDVKRYHGDNIQDVDIRMDIDRNLIATIVCPQDFLRFITLKLSSWNTEVRELVSPQSPEYRTQKYASIGGSVTKPTVVLSPFGEYILKVTGTISGAFTVGETVTGSGGPSGCDAFTATVKTVTSGYIVLKNVSGVVGTTRAHSTITGDSSSATITTYADIQDEFNKYKKIKTFTGNVMLSDLYNRRVAETLTLATNDIVSASAQTDPDENGTYLINATGTPTKLSNDINTPQVGASLEVYRSQSTNDTIDKFHYIPKLLPEEMPEELLDAVIDRAAGRLLKYLGRAEAARIAYESAAYLMGSQLQGFKQE